MYYKGIFGYSLVIITFLRKLIIFYDRILNIVKQKVYSNFYNICIL